MEKLLATCVCLPCSPWSADTENSLSLLLALLHTDRIENRWRRLELNPNMPPEPAPSCAEVQALSAKDKIKKIKHYSDFLVSFSSFSLLIFCLVCLCSSFKVCPPTPSCVLLFSHASCVALRRTMSVSPPLRSRLKYLHNIIIFITSWTVLKIGWQMISSSLTA